MNAPFEAALAGLRSRLGRQIVAEIELAAEPARCADLSPPLPPALARALTATGVERFWRHQVEALSAARVGESVLVTTSTASGKSLVFQAPVLEEAIAGGPGRALFLFPLKALGQDQRAKFASLAAAAGLDAATASCAIYDGDTPAAERTRIRRDPPRVLITNPDMLHLGILPSAPSWTEFLRDLRWIVLDELHAYRGIFGAHLHHVLARLLRQARALGARPSFVAASATAAGADEFAAALAGVPFRWVAESGAPREARRFVLVRPSASPYTAALDAFSSLIENGQKTIAFTKARRITELLWTWLARREPALAARVRSYRAGFLAEERREIERRLFSGDLDGVLSTSALEMGIDVGGLDACVLVGFPGSVMATWQRSGRVGRSGRPSLTVLVALPDALDQYLLEHPHELIGRPCEQLLVDPANELVAREHLVCAASERALDPITDAALLERFAPVVGELLREGRLVRAADDDRLASTARRPQRAVSLRGTGATFAIQHAASGAAIGTVDGARVYAECHPGAVYLHAGRTFLVRELDLEGRRALVEPADVDWYTSALTEKATEILEVLAERSGPGRGSLRSGFGRLRVTERVVGFERRRTQGHEVLGGDALDLPPTIFEPQGLWWRAPEGAEDRFLASGRTLLGALHALEHAAIGLFPLLALCDRNDLGGISLAFHPQLGGAGVFVYEGHAGGVGIAARGFRDLPELLRRVAARLERCECEVGCPSCVQSPKCGNGNRPLDKAGALEIARTLLARADDSVIVTHPSSPPPSHRAERARRNSSRFETQSEVQAGRGVRSRTSAGTERLPVKGVGGPGAEAEARGSDDSSVETEASHVASAIASSAPSMEGSRAESAVPGPADWTESNLTQEKAGAFPDDDTLPGAGPESAVRPDPGVRPVHLSFPSMEVSVSPFAERRVERARSFASAPVAGVRGTVLFDVETLRSAQEVGGWHRAHRMGIAVAVVCHLEAGRFEVYREPDVPRLVGALKGAGRVVGYNSRRFDYAVISGYTGEDYGRSLPTLDLLESLRERLRYRVGLGHVARETLGVDKSADGLRSLEWVRAGRLDLVEQYCLKDVEILRDLYLFGRREGYVVIADRAAGRVRVRVDW